MKILLSRTDLTFLNMFALGIDSYKKLQSTLSFAGNVIAE